MQITRNSARVGAQIKHIRSSILTCTATVLHCACMIMIIAGSRNLTRGARYDLERQTAHIAVLLRSDKSAEAVYICPGIGAGGA